MANLYVVIITIILLLDYLLKDSERVICYHQTRDMATPGFGKPSRDMEKKYPGVVLANRTFWGLCIMNSYF